jgi:sulfide:quinone oxidoreductase
VQTGKAFQDLIRRMSLGENVTIVIGTGHGTCTCEGAAFEYIANVHNELTERGLRDKAHIIWLSNEPKLGDFGIDGIEVKRDGEIFTSEMMIDAVFADYGVEPVIASHVHRVDEKTIYTEDIRGNFREIHYDFAMLLPPFKGVPIRYIDRAGEDITSTLCNAGGFLKVDANYGKKPEELDGPDWPKTYQNPVYENIYAAGIAFAPPGPLSKPGKSPNGAPIAPAPPRTGYTSELSGKAAALNIASRILGEEANHTASMAATPGLCIASMRHHLLSGTAATIAIYPVARDYSKYPEFGRDLSMCNAEVGLAGAWTKIGLHHAFMYKLKAKPFWKEIP